MSSWQRLLFSVAVGMTNAEATWTHADDMYPKPLVSNIPHIIRRKSQTSGSNLVFLFEGIN